MPEQPPSPWARSGSGVARPEAVNPPTPVPLTPTPPALARPASGRRQGATATHRSDAFGAGTVTGIALLPPRSTPAIAPAPDPDAKRRRTMFWFGGTAVGIVASAVVILLALVLTGNNPIHRTAAAPPDTRAPLAKLCPPPSAAPAPLTTVPATPAGARTVDRQSGISYRAYGAPWQTWQAPWTDSGNLDVSYRTGQYFVTEEPPWGQYLATILSASVPTATNDALTLDLRCTGTQVAADVRVAFYPQPNTMDPIRDGQTTLGGRPAWVNEFRLHFHEAGLKATSELVAVAVIDVGRPDAAILYISIPGTHDQYDYVVDELLDSIRPTG